VTRRLDPARDDAGVRLRTARLRRGMTQIALAEMACISPSFVSMVETGERELTRVCDIVALADILRVSPLYLADGRIDPAAGQRPARTVPFPARTDPRTLARHRQLARQFVQLAGPDRRSAGDWLRRLARDPTVSSWLLLDQLATLLPTLVTPTCHPRVAANSPQTGQQTAHLG
jgi:transcriptional regulator with XRE-family HTH domain